VRAMRIVRAQRAFSAAARPLKLIVRFRMRKTPAFLLAVLVTLGSKSLPAQTKTAVDVRVSAETCLIGNLNVPCSDVGENLRKLGVPLDAHIHLSGDKHMTYSATSAALESLSRAGYKLKIGYVNVQPQ
jgi:biopolymer transport protein ExbD